MRAYGVIFFSVQEMRLGLVIKYWRQMRAMVKAALLSVDCVAPSPSYVNGEQTSEVVKVGLRMNVPTTRFLPIQV